MTKSVVRRAYQAFCSGDYEQAIQLYREAGDMLGEHFFATNLRISAARLHRVCASRSAQKLNGSEYADTAERIKFADSFRVALIADEFTTNSFANEFVAIPIEPTDWREKFEKYKPDVFFCESAWSGSNSLRRPWKGKIYASTNFRHENRTALLEILSYCRKEGIPSIFWNKEDPTHFSDRVHDFVKTATEFDFIFTTAEECIDRYKKEWGAKNVYVLPFASNPHLFNPIENGDRSSRIIFAGSWYANHVQRSKEMEQILDGILADGYELEIYDRYYGDTDPLHVWPARFQQYLRPAQPHSRMPAVYKASRFGLNFNTVTTSPTMFARRVFELMSSNTLVISNYSRGTEEMFGDLIIYPDKQPDRLRSLNETEIDVLREKALQKVLGEHTYRHRWLQILKDVGLPHATRKQAITVACIVNSQTDAELAVNWYQQCAQSNFGARLLLVAGRNISDLDVADLYCRWNRYGVTVTSLSHAIRYALPDRYHPIETSHFLAFFSTNLPPVDWLERAIPHMQYQHEYPLVPAASNSHRYRIGLSETASPVLDLRERFGMWLNKPEERRRSYLI